MTGTHSGIQLDLFGDGISDVYVVKHALKNHKIKLYKRCSVNNCTNLINNKPSRHYCWECKIKFAPMDRVQDLRVIIQICKNK